MKDQKNEIIIIIIIMMMHVQLCEKLRIRLHNPPGVRSSLDNVECSCSLLSKFGLSVRSAFKGERDNWDVFGTCGLVHHRFEA